MLTLEPKIRVYVCDLGQVIEPPHFPCLYQGKKSTFLAGPLSGWNKIMTVKGPGREYELSRCVWNQRKQFTKQINSINSGVRGDT